MPDRIQLRRTPGWRLPDNAVKIDRTTHYGNPFKIGGKAIVPGLFGAEASPYQGYLPVGKYAHGVGRSATAYAIVNVTSVAQAVAWFIDWIKHEPAWRVQYLAPDLAGKDLACWCPLPEPGQPDICHAAALIAWVNGGRFWTPDWTDDQGATRLTVKRCCNGCNTRLGDVTDAEIAAAIDGLPLPDVRSECPTCSGGQS
jgi:hypothetical protein